MIDFILNCWAHLSPQSNFKFFENKWFLFHLCMPSIAWIIKDSPINIQSNKEYSQMLQKEMSPALGLCVVVWGSFLPQSWVTAKALLPHGVCNIHLHRFHSWHPWCSAGSRCKPLLLWTVQQYSGFSSDWPHLHHSNSHWLYCGSCILGKYFQILVNIDAMV